MEATTALNAADHGPKGAPPWQQNHASKQKISCPALFKLQNSLPNFTMALFTSHPNPKYFLFHPSHQIFRRIHGALNIGKKDN
jgi:hypothetical protein